MELCRDAETTRTRSCEIRERCNVSRGRENIGTAIDLQQIGHDEPIPLHVHVNSIQRPRLTVSGHANEIQEAVIA